MKPGRILLLGMMGAGKTSVGRALEARTGWGYRDNDELVIDLTGASARELLEERGEAALREAEAQALAKATSEPPPFIAGIAAGVVESMASRELLIGDDSFVVYLHAPVDVLIERVGSGDGRPWLQPDPETALRKLYDGREPRYREVADLVIEVGDGTPEEHADRVLEALKAREGA